MRRLPWVSITLAGLCIVVFAGLSLTRGAGERRAHEAAREALAYYEEHPHLEAEEDLLFAETGEDPFAVPDDGASWLRGGEVSESPPSRVASEQAELDRLTADWRRAVETGPERVLGLVPAEVSAASLVTHMFVHAGILHLIGNLFFFWLLAPPLEDVWGRPLFAAFYLAAGLAAGLMWVARYSNSEVPVIGASGAIAGLMGAFMVRFWRSRIKFVYVLWLGLRVFFGSFKAPAWLMLGLWFAREAAMATWIEPHVTAGGGVAIWAHVYGFAFGAAGAALIAALGVERRWIRPKLVAMRGELENPALEKAVGLETAGRLDEAWTVAREEIAARPDNWDAVLFCWDLACRNGREAEMAPHLVRAIRHEAARGEIETAQQHWNELRERLPGLEPPPTLELAMAEGLLDAGWSRVQVEELLQSAREKLGGSPPPGLAVKLARLSARAGLPGAADLCTRLASDPELPAAVRSELLALAEGEGAA